ncbi:MAG: ABC transporter substrate-binding protein, partial [Gammaproteobacteria bacterium]|nr:ABC transporter substrate-binding protein [Gammaproteobacteria bacterium]
PPVYAFNKMLVERVAKSGKTQWAAVNHSYEWGQSNLAAFKLHLGNELDGIEWVDEQWAPIGKLDAGAVVQSLLASKPDAIYSALWGTDLTNFIREGRARGLFEGRIVVADQATRPIFFDQMGDETLTGILGIGVPASGIEQKTMSEVAERYAERSGGSFRYTGSQAYHTMQLIADGIEAAGTTETEALIDALEGLEAETIFGPVTIRVIDHQSTSGIWIGEAGFVDGRPQLVNWEFKDGNDYFPTDDYILNLRQ